MLAPYQKLWKFDLLLKKYGTIPKTMEHWYTMGKKHVSVPKTTYEILTDNEKNPLWYYAKTMAVFEHLLSI